MKRMTIIVVLICAAAATYAWLLKDGILLLPDFKGIARAAGFETKTLAQTVSAWIIIGAGVAAIFVPLIYAIRAADWMTIAISFVMTGVAVALWLTSDNAIVQITGLIIYVANILLSAIVFAAHKMTNR